MDFLPVSSHQGLQLLGEGSTTEVSQSIVNVENAFAFKQKSSRTGKKDSELLHALCTEILILRHPPIQEDCNIVDVVGINWQDETDDGTVWPTLVFPKARFGSLQEFLTNSPGLEISIDEKLRLCSGVINAVQKLHACGRDNWRWKVDVNLTNSNKDIVHGDLKPENILIFEGTTADYFAKVADFGWSCFESIPGGEVFPPKSKPWFASEWHHRGVSIEDAKRMDIFSLGMLCLWIILQHIVRQLSGVAYDEQIDSWLGLFRRANSTMDLLVEWKDRKALPDLAAHALEHLDGVVAQDKSSLLVFFHRSLQDSYLKRESDILRLADDLGGHG